MKENLLEQQKFTGITVLRELISLTSSFFSKSDNCWIIFDVDYTLTMPEIVFEEKSYGISKKNMMEALSDISNDKSFDRTYSSSIFLSRRLIDENAPEVIAELKKNGAKVFALTAALGKDSLRQLRFDRLKKMGVDFSDSFDFSEVLLDDIPPFLGYRARYSNGILYANGEHGPNCNKGFVLTSFMNKIGQKPTHIVFIDDRKKNLEDLQKTFENSEIKFFGILYADKKEYEEVPVDIIRKELTKLLSEGVL